MMKEKKRFLRENRRSWTIFVRIQYTAKAANRWKTREYRIYRLFWHFNARKATFSVNDIFQNHTGDFRISSLLQKGGGIKAEECIGIKSEGMTFVLLYLLFGSLSAIPVGKFRYCCTSEYLHDVTIQVSDTIVALSERFGHCQTLWYVQIQYCLPFFSLLIIQAACPWLTVMIQRATASYRGPAESW